MNNNGFEKLGNWGLNNQSINLTMLNFLSIIMEAI